MTDDVKSVLNEILSEVKIGDRVFLDVNGRFFNRSGSENEMYAGFVAGLTDRVITISPTPESNNYHGYVSSEERQQRKETRLELDKIVGYQIL